jgi:hypothetical protein
MTIRWIGRFHSTAQHRRILGGSQGGEQPGWRLVVEDASGPGVELVLDRQQVLRRVDAQVGALWEVVSQATVGVFVRAALPGRVRVAEVDRGA